MMMQALDRGGVKIFTDGARAADSDNPRGYYEHEKATRIARESSWIPEVRGGCVKIMAQLLPMLPSEEHYRIIFMNRDLREIARSQRTMLDRLGSRGTELSDARLITTFDAQMAAVEEWIRKAPNVRCLHVDYHDVLRDPVGSMFSVGRFLDDIPDVDAMASAIEPGLRRQNASG